MKNLGVLIVEDERLIAIDIQDSLEKLGVTVLDIVSTGEEAVEIAQKIQPGLVLMDIQLRGEMDGVEAARQIAESARVPVIFLTAYADDSLLERARTVGSFGYLVKPFEDRELRAMIEVAIYKHRADLEREELIGQLTEANEKINTLRGIIPICAVCKKIRDDKGYWAQLEIFMEQHSEAVFSHGLCPDCATIEMAAIEEEKPPPENP